MDDGTLSWTPEERGPSDPGAGSKMPAVGDLLADRFLLKRVVGSGGSGTVFAALDTRINQEVAVKVLHPRLVGRREVARLRREVQAARGSDPNTVALFDLHSDGGLYFLSMELVHGESLKELLARRGKFEAGETARFGARLGAALASFHARGIIHRDVKPGNVLVTGDGDVKLCDMGLARPLESGLTVTETAMVVGTPAFMAPEQATGRELTPAVDVYSLGLTLYAMLTGAAPLQDRTALSTLMRRQREHAPPVRRARPDCPRWLGRLIARMLEPSPADRPSAKEVEHALEHRAYGFWVRRRVAVAAAALVILGASAPVAYSWLRRAATVRVVASGTGVRGVDARDRTTWTYDLGVPVGKVLQVDLDGDGGTETVIGSKLPDGDRRLNGPVVPARVAVLTRSGRVLTNAKLQDVIGPWPYPYREELRIDPQVMDLDHDGVPEIVVYYHQRTFYPSGILIYWPRWDTWDPVLTHTGYIDAVVPAPGGRPGLRFTGLNNRFCMFRVLGEIGLVPPSSPGNRSQRSAISSPDNFFGDSKSVVWHWYTLVMGPAAGAMPWESMHLRTSADDGAELQMANGAVLRFDRFGNPAGSANSGRDLHGVERQFFESLLYLEAEAKGMTPSAVRRYLRGLESSLAPLLAEKPFRVVFGLKGGRALAEAGDPQGAIALLRKTAQVAPNEDVVYRLAQIEAVMGRLRAAEADIAPVLEHPHSSRGTYDVPQLGIRLGIESRDGGEVGTCVEQLLNIHPGTAASSGLAAALLARAHLWWDEIGPADLDVGSFICEPAGEAMACLCRWRVGRMRPGDADAMRAFVRDNPDAHYEGRLALAAAEMAAGRPEKGQAILDGEITVLEMVSRDDFFNHQLLDLARAMRCKALLAAGRRARAKEEAEKLLRRLTPGLLPARLAREVVAAVG